jgi:5-(carboxyamino)imidazole ribonucleotide synthase
MLDSKSSRVVGILGDGQLARMLCEAARELKLESWVLGSSLKSPAASKASKFFTSENRSEFFEGIDYLTFENEFFDPKLLERSLNPKTTVFPDWKIILALRDKWEQKQLLIKLGLPTSAAHLINSDKELKALKFPYVLKWSVGGYDGKGTLVVKDNEALNKAIKFLEEGFKRGAKVYREDFIPFDLELAILSGQNIKSETFHFPLVHSQQENNVCKWTKSFPITDEKRKELFNKATQISTTLLNHFSYVGLLAVEMFLSPDGQLLVNELAPRVHNSGHYTLSASRPSQFVAHLMCGTSSLKMKPMTAPHFVMWNLLGPAGYSPQSLEHPHFPSANFDVYWYDKTEVKEGRKMGHLSKMLKNADEELKTLEEMKNWEIELWQKNLK